MVFLSREKLFEGLSEPNEADAMRFILSHTDVKYSFFEDFYLLKENERPNGYFINTANGHVTELELVLNQVNKDILPLIKEFKNLRTLILHFNLNGKIPDFDFKIFSITNLKIFCKGKVIIPDFFGCFPNLEVLRVYGYNTAKFSSIPDTLSSLENLSFLELNGIKLKRLPNLTKLESLIIICAGLEYIPIEIFYNKKLKWIDLRGNSLTNAKFISMLKDKKNVYFAI